MTTPFTKAVRELAIKDLIALGKGLLILLGLCLWFFAGAWVGWMLREEQAAVIFYGWPKGFLFWWRCYAVEAFIFSVFLSVIGAAIFVFIKRYVTAAARIAVRKE